LLYLDNSLVLYLQGGTWNPAKDINANWRDPKLNIQWPPLEGDEKEYIISQKDSTSPMLED
jgi:dTDP-4-dehydrorhamnose 3,5-epimerase-like enzyme